MHCCILSSLWWFCGVTYSQLLQKLLQNGLVVIQNNLSQSTQFLTRFAVFKIQKFMSWLFLSDTVCIFKNVQSINQLIHTNELYVQQQVRLKTQIEQLSVMSETIFIT